MFSASKYNDFINRLNKYKILTYVIYGLIGCFVGSIGDENTIVNIIFGIAIGLYIAYKRTLALDIKIQKMYWEIDIYNKINKIEENNK